MAKEPQLTAQTRKVLSALMSRPRAELSGAEIGKSANLASGTLYPILFRLEEAGWLTSHWEKGDPATLGRPRRRYYSVTAEGARIVRGVVEDLTPVGGTFAWGS
jgi:PadR family transcriptional regulator, regulatory protein PadR